MTPSEVIKLYRERHRGTRQDRERRDAILAKVKEAFESDPSLRIYTLGLEAGALLQGPKTEEAIAALKANIAEARKLGVVL